jgi:hypothetical protein
VIVYAVIAIPIAWLDGFSKQSFSSLTGLYVVYAVVSLMIVALLNIYNLHLMNSESEKQQHLRQEPTDTDAEDDVAGALNQSQTGRQKVGTWLSVFGIVTNCTAGIIALVLSFVLSVTLPLDGQEAA